MGDGSKGENNKKRTRTWTYYTSIALPMRDTLHPSSHLKKKKLRNSRYILVLEGVKMGATVSVNGIHLGNVTDQFLRYTFPITNSILTSSLCNDDNNKNITSKCESNNLFSYKETLQMTHSKAIRNLSQLRNIDANTIESGNHETKVEHTNMAQLNIEISFDPNIDTEGRFMACSGGWDWAPYSRSLDSRGLSKVFSFGIYKPVYILEVHTCQIIHVVPKVSYLGTYPK